MKKSINKATVVIVLSLSLTAINYLVYPIIMDTIYQSNLVPIANRTIRKGGVISENDIDYIEIKGEVGFNILTDINMIVGKQVEQDILVNDFFASENLQEKQANDKKYIFNLEINDESCIGNHNVDLIYLGSDNRQNNKQIVGLLASNVEVVSYDESERIVSLLVDEKQLDYCLKAKKLGNIVLISSNQISQMEKYYSIEMLYAFIDEYALSFREVSYE